MKPSLACLAAILATAACGPARAAESYDSCTGFIESLPAVITTQGTWCLAKDLSTALSNGNAISINANNVTLDCNRFKLGGLAAGAGTNMIGITAVDRSNATIRNCNVRGFYIGAYLYGDASSGHLVEDNVFDANTYQGLSVAGDGGTVRRNRILDTGGSTLLTGYAYGIAAMGDVEVSGNVVSSLAAQENEGGVAFAYGIRVAQAQGARIRDNQVRGLVQGSNGGSTWGIYLFNSQYLDISDNLLVGPLTFGVDCSDATSIARANVITQATILPVNNCNASGNLP